MAVRFIGFETLANFFTTGDQNTPSVTGLSGGRFVISWQDAIQNGGDIREQMFNGDGSKFGGEFLVNAATANEQARPALAGLTGGGFVDTFDTNSNGTGNLHISGRLFNSAGNALVNGVNISNNEFTINTTAGDERDPVVAALAGGGFVAAYVPGSGGFVSARIFNSMGTPVVNGVTSNTNDFVVDSNSHFGQFDPFITALSGGGFLVTYTEQFSLGGSTDVEARLFDASGNLASPAT